MSQTTVRYLALGDSFTIGTGVGAERSFPAEITRLLKTRGVPVGLTNPAVNGYTTDDLIEHELPLARAARPDLVTVLIGANDIVRGRDASQYRARLRRIFAELDAAGIERAAIYGLPQPDWSGSPGAAGFGTPDVLRARITEFNAILREEVERAGGAFVDLFPLMRRQAAAGMLAPDGLHPSADALAEWAAALAPELLVARPR